VAHKSGHCAADRYAAGDLELGAVLVHHHARRAICSSKEPIEAASILGASNWRVFWEVQLPLLRPVILLALVLRFLEAMAEFPKTWALLQGGPGTATETVPVYIFLTTWQYFEISKGAAMSYIVMLLMIVVVLLAIRLLRREKRSLDAMHASSAAGEEPAP
jgi:ABC-type Fe3+ transport system permease subunit